MNYNEALEVVESNRKLTGKEFKVPDANAYGKVFRLVISPKGKAGEVLSEWVAKDCDNMQALLNLGMIDEELFVSVVGIGHKAIMYPISLEMYLATHH